MLLADEVDYDELAVLERAIEEYLELAKAGLPVPLQTYTYLEEMGVDISKLDKQLEYDEYGASDLYHTYWGC